MLRRRLLFLVTITCAMIALWFWVPSRFDDAAERKGDTLARMEVLKIGLAEFSRRHGRYPTQSEGLGRLGDETPPIFQGVPRGSDEFELDGWGRRFAYEIRPDGRVVIRSLGANGVDETAEGDDITATVPQ